MTVARQSPADCRHLGYVRVLSDPDSARRARLSCTTCGGEETVRLHFHQRAVKAGDLLGSWPELVMTNAAAELETELRWKAFGFARIEGDRFHVGRRREIQPGVVNMTEAEFEGYGATWEEAFEAAEKARALQL